MVSSLPFSKSDMFPSFKINEHMTEEERRRMRASSGDDPVTPPFLPVIPGFPVPDVCQWMVMM